MEPQKKVKVKLSTTITHPDHEQETYELWSEGTYVEKTGKSYLTYDELQESVSDTIHTTVKMGNEEAVILRNGGVKMRLPFAMKFERNGSYQGEFGTLLVTTKTRSLHFEKENGRFSIEYDLLTSGTLVGNYKLDITYTEVTS